MTLPAARRKEIETLQRRRLPITKGETFLGDEYLSCQDAIRDLLAALPEWREIEDCPPEWKDGRLVDLWCVGDPADIEFYCVVHRRHKDRVRREGRVTNVAWIDGAWRPQSGLTRLHRITVTPTHVRALPEPPA